MEFSYLNHVHQTIVRILEAAALAATMTDLPILIRLAFLAADMRKDMHA